MASREGITRKSSGGAFGQNCRKAVTQSFRPGADAPGSGVAGGVRRFARRAPALYSGSRHCAATLLAGVET